MMNVYIIAALSADGFIARSLNQTSLSWTSREDKRYFSKRTKKSGVVIMGRKTYETIGRPLPGRLNIVYTQSSDFSDISNKPNLRFTKLSPNFLIKQLQQEGFKEIAICGGAGIYTLFIRSGLVNNIYLTVEPILFGSGVKLFTESVDVRTKLMKTRKLSNQTVLLEYHVISQPQLL